MVRRCLALALRRRSCMAEVEVRRLAGAGTLPGCRAEEWHSDWPWNLAGEGSSCRWGSSCSRGAGDAKQDEEKADTARDRRIPRKGHSGHHHILQYRLVSAWKI